MPESRKQIAVMFTDIVGYTALMGSDEDKAFDILRQNRGIHTKFINEFQGTLIKEMENVMFISFDLVSGTYSCTEDLLKRRNLKA